MIYGYRLRWWAAPVAGLSLWLEELVKRHGVVRVEEVEDDG